MTNQDVDEISLGARLSLTLLALTVAPVFSTTFVMAAFAPAIIIPFMLRWSLSGATYDSTALRFVYVSFVIAQLLVYAALFFWGAGALLRRLAQLSLGAWWLWLAGMIGGLLTLAALPIYSGGDIGGGAWSGNWEQMWHEIKQWE